MMKFNWEEFMDKDNKIAVHCKTEKEAIDFCKQMDEHGMEWCDGNSYLKKNHWKVYKKETCYSNNCAYSDLKFYETENYIILEWSDYMVKDPIDYLEYGYIVEFENGERAMYMPSQEGDCFDFGNRSARCLLLDSFDNNLKSIERIWGKYDIKKIYGYTQYPYMTTYVDIENRPLIWERPKEVKKMTVSEICKELGYKVEIVAEEE